MCEYWKRPQCKDNRVYTLQFTHQKEANPLATPNLSLPPKFSPEILTCCSHPQTL